MNSTLARLRRASCGLALLFAATAYAQEQPAPVTYPQVSEAACPLQVTSIPGKAGNEVPVVVRQPPGMGRFPAVIALHGGLSPYRVEQLKDETLTRPNYTRFLAAGFVLVVPTFRSREENPQTRDALDDCLAVVDYVKKMPNVDPNSVAIFGGSGGGSLALELAGETDLCAVVAGEPATVLFTGLMVQGMADRNQAFQQRMKEPKKHLTPELLQFTRAKIAKIHCPVLILHGDVHPLKIINREVIVPELKTANKSVEYIEYAGQPHAFWWGAMDAAVGQKVFDDSMRFLTPNLKTQPIALDESLIKRVTAGRERGEKAAGKRNRKAN
ncbi:MAG TPA: prolyl oligopeptidase family serine peptidase [Pirellulaceae bacterium]